MGIREFSYPAWGQLGWGRLVLEPDFSRRQRFNCWRLGGLLLEDWALALAASLPSSTLIPAIGKPSIQREKGPTSQLGLV